MTLRKRVSRFAVALLLRAVMAVTAILPWRFAVWLGGGLGLFLFYLLGRYRRASFKNFQTAFGAEKDPDETSRIVKKSFIHLGKSLIEILNLPHLKPAQMDSLVSWEGEEYLKEANGKGILLITGHIGNWELLGAAFAHRGYPLHAIATPLYNTRINELIINLRSRYGVKTISRGTPSSSRKILEVLRKKEILGLLIDQDTRVDGVFVPFFNKKAYTPSGAAQLAMRSDAVTVTAFITRLADNRHRLTIEKPVEIFRAGDRKENIEKNTALFTSRIERHIRMHPDQWVWMHERWKTEGPADGVNASRKPQTSEEERCP